MDREHKRYNLNFCLPCKGWFCSLRCSLSWVISMCWRKVCALCGCCMNFFSTTSIMSADLSSTRPAINACCLLPAWMGISFELYLVLQLFVELPSPTLTHYSICFDSLLFVMHLRKDPFSPNLLEFPWAFSICLFLKTWRVISNCFLEIYPLPPLSFPMVKMSAL